MESYNFIQIDFNSSLGDLVGEVVDARIAKGALGPLCEEFVCKEVRKYMLQLCEMILPGDAVNKNVIEEYEGKSLDGKVKNRLHECLKG